MTKDPIAKQEEKTKQEAYKAVFKDADRFEAVKLDKKEINKALKAKNLGQNTVSEIAKAVDKDGKGLGYVFSVTNPDGYGGDITPVSYTHLRGGDEPESESGSAVCSDRLYVRYDSVRRDQYKVRLLSGMRI